MCTCFLQTDQDKENFQKLINSMRESKSVSMRLVSLRLFTYFNHNETTIMLKRFIVHLLVEKYICVSIPFESACL